MFVLHGPSKLLTPSGRYVKVDEAKVGMRIVNGGGHSVKVTDILRAHVPYRKDETSAFHNIKHLAWPSKIPVYDQTPILTNYGPLLSVDDNIAGQNTIDPPVHILCPKTIRWDTRKNTTIPLDPSYTLGYTVGVFYAARKDTDVGESSPTIRATTETHLDKLTLHIHAALPGSHKVDERNMTVTLDTKYSQHFHSLEHKNDLSTSFIIPDPEYACGLYMGLNDQMKDSGILHENIYRAMVLSLFLQGPVAQLEDQYLRFPLQSRTPKTKRIRIAYVLKVSDPDDGLFIDNTVIMPTRVV
jgi:hypothetical protein